MDKVSLSEIEKDILLYLSEKKDIELFVKYSNPIKSSAVKRLQELQFANAHYEEGGDVVAAKITNDGIRYLHENPSFDDPLGVKIELLTKENLILQNNELRYKAKIKYWQIASAVLLAISTLLSILAFFFKFKS